MGAGAVVLPGCATPNPAQERAYGAFKDLSVVLAKLTELRGDGDLLLACLSERDGYK